EHPGTAAAIPGRVGRARRGRRAARPGPELAPDLMEAGTPLLEGVWSAEDTSPSKIEAALRHLLEEQNAKSEGGYAPARVLNLVVVLDKDWRGEIVNRLERVGRYHPSRTIVCAVEQGRDSIDARATMSCDEPEPGGLAPVAAAGERRDGPAPARLGRVGAAARRLARVAARLGARRADGARRRLPGTRQRRQARGGGAAGGGRDHGRARPRRGHHR